MKAKLAETTAFLGPLLAECFTGCAFLFSHSCCDALEEENLPFSWGILWNFSWSASSYLDIPLIKERAGILSLERSLERFTDRWD